MGTGYVRNDTGNNIADTNIINAADLDGEYDAIEAAFDGSTGHSHDGSTGEGPVIAEVAGGVLVNGTTIIFEGTADAFETTIAVTDPTADVTVTFPDATDTLVGKATTDTLTNKTHTDPVLNGTLTGTAFLDEDTLVSDSAIAVASQQSIKAYVDAQVTAADLDLAGDTGTDAIDLDSETLTLAGGTGITSVASTGTSTVTFNIDSTVATLTGSQTLTNKTITSAVLNTAVSGTAVLDEDTLVSNSATQLATQQSIKAYVDAQVTASDLDFSADSGGALSIDLDSEALTLTGGTGIDTTGLANDVSFAIDSTVTTLTGSQTLTNKTLTAPVLNGIISGTGFVDDDSFTTPAATTVASSQSIKAYVDAQVTAQDLDFSADAGGALSIDLDSEAITFTGGTGIDTTGSLNDVSFAIDSTVATLTGSQTLTNKTLTTPTIDLSGVTSSGDLGVADGGTGASTLTDGGVLLGSGTGAVTAMAVLADGEMIVGDGTTDPVAESGATLRTSIGLGTVATLNSGTSSGSVPLVGTKSSTTTLAGLVERSTSAENVTGTDDTVTPTVAGVKEMIDTHGAPAGDGGVAMAIALG